MSTGWKIYLAYTQFKQNFWRFNRGGWTS